MGLHQRFPKTYEALYKVRGTQPYAIHAPLSTQSQYKFGEIISFDLTLFGDGTQHAPQCMEAVYHVSRSGLGKRTTGMTRGTAELLTVESVTPSEVRKIFPGAPNSLPVSSPFLAEEVLLLTKGYKTNHIQLVCDTPLRIKSENRLSFSPPSFQLIMQRVLGRMNQILPTPYTWEKKIILERAENVMDGFHNIQWVDVSRWSSRQEKEIMHGGIIGVLEYIGDMTEFLPWLGLGQWLQIGNKTTFGLGVYRLAVAPSDP
jgi:hypothetical protein